MSETPGRGGVKTLAIRLPDELHAQLVLIAQLDDLTLTDTIRAAIEALIDRKRAEGDLAGRAARAIEEMDREAAARRSALQALFAPRTDDEPAPQEQSPARGRSRRAEPKS